MSCNALQLTPVINSRPKLQRRRLWLSVWHTHHQLATSCCPWCVHLTLSSSSLVTDTTLGMHAIKDKPVVVNGQIVIRPIMVVALTYDHRLLDGREAVTFLGTYFAYLSSPLTPSKFEFPHTPSLSFLFPFASSRRCHGHLALAVDMRSSMVTSSAQALGVGQQQSFGPWSARALPFRFFGANRVA